MKKLAIFVEGQTEQIFIEKLLKEIAGENKITIVTEKAKKNSAGNRVFSELKLQKITDKTVFYILIRDSSSDEKVKSDILDTIEALNKSGYELVIGLRDIYPKNEEDLRKYLYYGVPTKFIPIKLVLAKMELEAWFIAEHSHFQRIHKALTYESIEKNKGYDVRSMDVESISWPANELDEIYRLKGIKYTKKRCDTSRTINKLDFAQVYLSLPNKVPSLKELIDTFEGFLT